MSYTYEITTAGKVLIAKAQTGTMIDFTKIEVGKGDLVGSSTDFTSLLDPVSTNAKIQQKEYIEGSEEAKITITYTNDDIDEGFYVKEIGLYANDPDVGEILFLYCYSEEADFLPPLSYASVEQIVNLLIAVDNASEVTARILPETNVIRNNFYANSILKADTDSEPEALIIEENRILGRKEGGLIDDLSTYEIREMLDVVRPNYSQDENYEMFRRVIGSDGNIYNCRKPNGPDLGGAIDPVGDTTLTWTTTEPCQAGDLIFLTYEPSIDEKLSRRMMEGTGATLADEDYPAILEKWGGKIYGQPDYTHFYTPVLSGKFLRIWDHAMGNDPDSAIRTRPDGQTGDLVGSKQSFATQKVSGYFGTMQAQLSAPNSANGAFYLSNTGYTGNSSGSSPSYRVYFDNNRVAATADEDRPINVYVWGGIFY